MKNYSNMSAKGIGFDLIGLHYQTALLESVAWNEEARDEMVEYITDYLSAKQIKKDVTPDDIKILLLNVEDTWGSPAKEVLKSIFNVETFYLNLNTQGNQDAH
mgnify:CR=1 FL=1